MQYVYKTYINPSVPPSYGKKSSSTKSNVATNAESLKYDDKDMETADQVQPFDQAIIYRQESSKSMPAPSYFSRSLSIKSNTASHLTVADIEHLR
jgi:hypothetical protein